MNMQRRRGGVALLESALGDQGQFLKTVSDRPGVVMPAEAACHVVGGLIARALHVPMSNSTAEFLVKMSKRV